jgi:hypothetical protein
MNEDNTKLPYWANNPTSVSLLKAYQRFLLGTTQVVKKNTHVNLSNISIEAGFHRSMLNKKRFPELCRMISEGNNTLNKRKSKTTSERLAKSLDANRNLRKKNDELKAQLSVFRDQLLAAERKIIQLNNRPNNPNDNIRKM